MKEFDIFRNMDDLTIERIADIHPVLTAEEKERMFAMSERKFNITEKRFPQGYNSETEDDDEVEGVEEYDRPAWLRYLTTAAALVLLGGGLAVGHNLLKRRPAPDGENNVPPVIATELETGTTVTSGADNSKYTTVSFDIDSMLTGTGASQVPAAVETTAVQTAAAVTPTAAPATAAPATEAPTEAPVPDIASYKRIATELESNFLSIERCNGNYYGDIYMDVNDQIMVYKAYDDGVNADEPAVYVRMFEYESGINSVDSFISLYNSTFTADSNIFRDIAGYVEPGGRYYDLPRITEYNGKLYHIYYPEYEDIVKQRRSGYPGDADVPSTWIGWEIYPEEVTSFIQGEVIIENATMDSFDAIIPVCMYTPYGDFRSIDEYNDNNHSYHAEKWHFVIENGQWKIQQDMNVVREWLSYSDYLAKLNAQ